MTKVNETAVSGAPESRESYEQELKQWGDELVARAISVDLSSDDCEKVESLAQGAAKAAIESFSLDTDKWTQGLFFQAVRRRAKSSSPHDAKMIAALLDGQEGASPAAAESASVAGGGEAEVSAGEVSLEQELSKYFADPTETLEQGELVSFATDGGGEENMTFLGVESAGSGVGIFGRKDQHGQIVLHRQNVSDFAEQSTEGAPEAQYESATAEPPPAIAAVAADVASPEGAAVAPISPEMFDQISPEKEKQLADKLNELKKKIDEQWEIINANKTQKDDPAAKKKYNAAYRELDRLLQESKDIALDLVGGEIVAQSIKPADAVAIARYNEKVGKVSREERADKEKQSGLSKEELDARYDGLRRKDAFADTLATKGVDRGVAMNLYQEFIKRAGELALLEAELAAGRNEVLTESRARKVLEWHGIDARQPKQVIAEIAPIIEEYKTIPPREERSKREAAEKGGKTAPLHERVLSGEIDITTLPPALLAKLVENKDEAVQQMARREVARREEEQKQKNAVAKDGEGKKPGKISALLSRIRDAILEKKGETVPRELLEKFSEDPEVAAYINKNSVAGSPSENPAPVAASSGEAGLTMQEKRERYIADYNERWSKKSEAERKEIIERFRASFREHQTYAMRRSDETIEQWMFMAVLEDGYAHMLEPQRFKEGKLMGKDVPLEELDELNPGVLAPLAERVEEGKEELYIGEHFPAAIEVIRKMQDPELSFADFRALAENYEKTQEKVGAPLWKERAEFSFAAPNGRRIRFSWDMKGPGNDISWRPGPDDNAEKPKTPDESSLASLNEAIGDVGREERIAQYESRWNQKTEEEKKKIVEICTVAFLPKQSYMTRLGNTTQEWTIYSVRADGFARMYRMEDPSNEDSRSFSRDVPLEELMELNPRALAAADAAMSAIFYRDRRAAAPETLESLTEKERIVRDASFVWYNTSKDESPESRWNRVAPLGMQIFHDALVACDRYPDEERFNAEPKDTAYLEECAQWLHRRYEEEIVPKLEKMQAEAAVTPVMTSRQTQPAETGTFALETVKSLEEKQERVFNALLVISHRFDLAHTEGADIKDHWKRVTKSDMYRFRDALAALNYPNLDEERFNTEPKDVAYMKELYGWLTAQYKDVLTPALEKAKREAAAASPVTPIDTPVSADEYHPSSGDAAQEAPLNHAVAKQFEERFGIYESDLQNIEVFKGLSSGQQLLVLQNLEQLTLSDIKKEARAEQKEESAKAGFFKRAVKSIMTLGMHPEIRTAQIEKELLARSRGGRVLNPESEAALAKKLAIVEELARVAKAGPEVEVRNGELEISYITKKDLWSEGDIISPERAKVLEDFNAAASNFAKIPHEWGYDTAQLTKDERKRYAETKDAYDRARGKLSALYRRRFIEEGNSDPLAATLQSMNVLDERMQMNQLFNAHPDAEAALQGIEDQNVIAAGAKEFWKKKGMFMVYGAAARAATLALLGTMPVVGAVVAYAGGAGVAGLVGKKIGETEAKRMFKEKRAEGRMSEEDLREEVSYNIYKTEVLPTGGNAVRVRDRDGNLVVERTEKRKIKEYTDATFFNDRVERLIDKLDTTEDPGARAEIEKKIAQTVALMHEKFEAGLINFGGSSLEGDDGRRGDTIGNRLSFIQAMALGRARTTIDNDNLEMEFSRMTKLHEAKIEEVRKKEIAKAGAKAAMWRAGFALAGAGIAQGVREIMHFGEVGFLGAPTIEHFNLNQVKMVGDAIRNAPNNTGLPDDVVLSDHAAVAKGFEDYMKDADPVSRAETAKVLGLSKEQMDAKIAEILGKTHQAAPVPAHGAEHAAPGVPTEHPDVSPDAQHAEDFNAKNFDKNIPSMVGRTPSAEELSVLRSTGGVDVPAQANMDQHNALIAAMKESKAPLSHAQIEAILGRAPAAGGAAGGAVESAAAERLPSHTVVSGDNLTRIIRGANIPELKDLSPQAQENAIQNLVKSLSPEELKEIGITDANKLQIGQTVDLNKILQLLHEKKLGGEDLLARAEHFTGGEEAGGEATSAAHGAGGEAVDTAQGGGVSSSSGVTTHVDSLTPEKEIAWSDLDSEGKILRADTLANHYIESGVNKLFVKSPFEEWPKEWVALRGRDATEFLTQTEKTVYSPLPGSGEAVPAGYEWPATEKIQKYIIEHGLTREHGFIPYEKETVGDFLKRALQEKILREGPLPEPSAQMATGGVIG